MSSDPAVPPNTETCARGRKPVVIWPMAVVLVATWWATGLFIHKRQYAQAEAQTARLLLEKKLFALDEMDQHPPPTTRVGQWWHDCIASREGVVESYDQLATVRKSAIGMSVEYALACDYFAALVPDRRWNGRSRTALASAGQLPANWSFYSAAAAALKDRKPTNQELQSFDDAVQNWPTDWWVARTATLLGRTERIDVAGIERRQHRAFNDLLTARSFCAWSLGLGLFLAALVCWKRRWFEAKPTRAAVRRLRKLWNPGAVIALFSVSSAAMLLAQIWASRQIWPALIAWDRPAEFVRSPFAGQIAVGTSVLVALLLLGLQVWLFHLVFSPRKRSARLALGVNWRDLRNPKLWMLGVSAAGCLTLCIGILGEVWERLHLGGNRPDFSRLIVFLSFGRGALPAALAFGCVVAPLVEEVIFRGYLFLSLSDRHGAAAAAICSSAIFALSHFYSPFGTIGVFVYGMGFAWVFHKTGSLAANMITHACVNLILIPVGFLEVVG